MAIYLVTKEVNTRLSKKFDNLFEKIIDEDNLYKAYKSVRRGSNKYHIEAIKFSNNETYNLKLLRDSLIHKTYKYSEYSKFYVYEPKERLIYAPSFIDKVVQIATNNILKEIYNKCFIFDSYGSIDNKGTHKCVEKISSNLRKAKYFYGDDACILKLDIKKFFYTIDRDILKNIYRKKIKCKDTLWLIDLIIDSADQIDKLGLPLGNTLSQLSANIYLNELDQYIKRVLRVKYYVRYMDDMILILKNKNEAKIIKSRLKIYLGSKLKMQLNENKSKIFPISQGVNAIGFKIYTTHRLLRNNSKKKIKRKCKAIPNLIINKHVKILKIEQILNSWLGHAKHGNNHNFINTLLSKNKFLALKKDCFKVKGESFDFI